MMKKFIIVLAILFVGMNTNAQEVMFYQVDSTYIIKASSAAKLSYMAERAMYLDTLIALNNTLYNLVEKQNTELDQLYNDFDQYKSDSESFNAASILTLKSKYLYYERQNRKNKNWKWFWAITSVVLTGVLILD